MCPRIRFCETFFSRHLPSWDWLCAAPQENGIFDHETFALTTGISTRSLENELSIYRTAHPLFLFLLIMFPLSLPALAAGADCSSKADAIINQAYPVKRDDNGYLRWGDYTIEDTTETWPVAGLRCAEGDHVHDPWIVAVPLTLDVGEEGATGDVELLLTDESHRVVSARLRLNKAFMLEAGESFLVAVAQHQDGTDASKRIFTLTKITRNDWTGGVAQKSTDYHLVGDKLVAFSSAVK